MDSMEALERELSYLTINTDSVYMESDEPEESKIGKIKSQFNNVSSHLDSAMVYAQSYVDDKSSDTNDTDYEERLKSLIIKAQSAIDSDNESMSIYDSRDIYDKFNKCKDMVFKELDDFVKCRSFKKKDDVISKADTIQDIIENFDKSMKKDVDLKVWLNPQTVKRVCENALTQGRSFNMDLKNDYMSIIRLNNKISDIVRDDSLTKEIKNEMVNSSLKCTRAIAIFCINWNKHLMTHYPMVKA